jgi:hypothetical protein
MDPTMEVGKGYSQYDFVIDAYTVRPHMYAYTGLCSMPERVGFHPVRPCIPIAGVVSLILMTYTGLSFFQACAKKSEREFIFDSNGLPTSNVLQPMSTTNCRFSEKPPLPRQGYLVSVVMTRSNALQNNYLIIIRYARVEVEVYAKAMMWVVRINVLEPAVERLMQAKRNI